MPRRDTIALCFASMSFMACAAPPEPPVRALLELTPFPTPMGGFALVLGHGGAVPSRALVSVIDLDLAEPLLAGQAARDGSFLLEPRAEPGHVLRLTATVDGRRSAPTDVIVAFGVPAAPLESACLQVPRELTITGAGAIPIENTCDGDRVLEDVRVRAPAAIEILAATPIVVPPEAGAEVELEIGEGGADEVVLLTFGAERRAVTVVGRGP